MGVAVADYDEDGNIESSKPTSATMCRTSITTSATGRSKIACCSQAWAATCSTSAGAPTRWTWITTGGGICLMINGHVYPEADRRRRTDIASRGCSGTSAAESSRTSRRRREPASTRRSSRGTAVGDLDNDGSLEIVVSNMGDPAVALQEYGPRQNWLLVRLVGARPIWMRSARAWGSRPGPPALGRGAGRESYISQSDSRIHVGLATSETLRSDRSPVAGGSARAVSRREGRPRRDVDRGSRNEPAAACRGAGDVGRGLQAPPVLPRRGGGCRRHVGGCQLVHRIGQHLSLRVIGSTIDIGLQLRRQLLERLPARGGPHSFFGLVQTLTARRRSGPRRTRASARADRGRREGRSSPARRSWAGPARSVVGLDGLRRVDLVLRDVPARQQLEDVEPARDLRAHDDAVVPVHRPGAAELEPLESRGRGRWYAISRGRRRVGPVEDRDAALVPAPGP